MDHEMTVDDLTCEWEENGELTVEMLEKEVLSKGAWVTVMYKYRERGRDGEWGPTKARVQRYKKAHGKYMSQSKFNISSAKQARKVVDILAKWFPDEA